MTIIFIATFALAVCLTPMVRALATRRRVFAYPDAQRRFHAEPVPLWGGVAIYLAMFVGLLLARCHPELSGAALESLAAALLPAAGLACLFGAIDDRRDLPARMKLLLQFFSVLPVVVGGYAIDRIVVFGCPITLGWLGIPITVLWLLGCINALNLIDGMDGLASIVGLSTAVMMAIIAVSTDNAHVAVFAVLLAGALAGFLLYNLPPASIFLGDSGSTLIGLVIGILGIQGTLKTSATLAITAPAVIMTLPMLDVVLAVVRRKLTGRRLATADREHIHHRLLDRGLSPWQVLCILGALCLTTGAAATAATIFRMDALAWITATTLVVLMVRLRLFGHHEFALVKGALLRGVGLLVAMLLRRGPRVEVEPAAAEPSLLEESPWPEADSLPIPGQPPRRKAA